MLSSLCQELRNWFDRDQPKFYGYFEIIDGKITHEGFNKAIQENQYFKINGSVFNNEVYKYTPDLELANEKFTGSIWLMAVPKEIIDLSNEIDEWNTKYKDVVSGPYQSESFGGYSYSKASGANGGNVSWQSTFASRLNKWRKI